MKYINQLISKDIQLWLLPPSKPDPLIDRLPTNMFNPKFSFYDAPSLLHPHPPAATPVQTSRPSTRWASPFPRANGTGSFASNSNDYASD